MACRQEMLTPQAPNLAFLRWFTHLHGLGFLLILSLSLGLYVTSLSDFRVCSLSDNMIRCLQYIRYMYPYPHKLFTQITSLFPSPTPNFIGPSSKYIHKTFHKGWGWILPLTNLRDHLEAFLTMFEPASLLAFFW